MKTGIAARTALRLVATTLLPLAAAAGTALAQDAGSAQNIAGFDRIQTAHVSFNYDTGNFTLPGRFTASSKGTEITADHATGNSKLKIMHAEGNVIVHQGAQARTSPSGATAMQRPSTLTCDKLDVDGVKKTYVATGHMHFTQEGGREATADSAVLNDATHTLHMQGNVHVRNNEQTIAASSIDYDTLSGQVEANGDVTIVSPAQTPPPGPPAPPRKRHII